MIYANKQKGFSLIEALVAFLIISVGMLGVASLQVLSLKAGHTASLRTLAVIKTEEILERMRSNNTVLQIYETTGAGADNGCDDHTGSIVMCTPAQFAADDVLDWKASLSNIFPTGTTGTIVVGAPTVAQPLSTVTITIDWLERDTETTGQLSMTYLVSLFMLCNSPTPLLSC